MSLFDILDEALAEIRKRRGIDLSGYRRGALKKRLAAHMDGVHCEDPASYLERLRSDPAEFSAWSQVGVALDGEITPTGRPRGKLSEIEQYLPTPPPEIGDGS